MPSSSAGGAVLLEALGSLVVALLIALVSTRLAVGSWPDLGNAIAGGSDAPPFPAFRVTECAAVILAIGAHLVRPLRTLGRWIVGFGVRQRRSALSQTSRAPTADPTE